MQLTCRALMFQFYDLRTLPLNNFIQVKCNPTNVLGQSLKGIYLLYGRKNRERA